MFYYCISIFSLTLILEFCSNDSNHVPNGVFHPKIYLGSTRDIGLQHILVVETAAIGEEVAPRPSPRLPHCCSFSPTAACFLLPPKQCSSRSPLKIHCLWVPARLALSPIVSSNPPYLLVNDPTKEIEHLFIQYFLVIPKT